MSNGKTLYNVIFIIGWIGLTVYLLLKTIWLSFIFMMASALIMEIGRESLETKQVIKK